MSRERSSSGGVSICLLVFVAMKASAHWYIAAWSWWWSFAPFVPLCALVLKKLGF